MKTKTLITALLAAAGTSLYGGAGIFDSFATVEGTFYDLGASTGNPDFAGSDFGDFNTTDTIALGGQLKSFKDSGTDVTGASINWVVFEQGNRPGTPLFTEHAYGFQIDNVGGTTGDQQWGTQAIGQKTTATPDSIDLSSLSAGDYTLEVFAKITTDGTNAPSEIFDNAGGSNYSGNFTVVPEPGTFALLSGLFALAFVALRARSRG